MATKVDIWNMALAHLGNTDRVITDADTTVAAKSCALFWDQVVDDVLRAVAWPFATKIAALAGKAAAPNAEWAFSYTYPADAVTIRKIVDPNARTVASKSRIPFRRTTNLVLTSQDNAIAEYTMRVSDTTLYSADFVQAVSLLLANRIAPSVAGGDQWKKADRMLERYSAKLQESAANASAEEKNLEEETDAAANPKEDICNMALHYLGVDVEIQDLDTERTKEARAFRQFYDTSLEKVLRDFDWPFARKTATLVLDSSDPTEEWAYGYDQPTDAVAIRRILNGSTSRVENEDTLVRFQIGSEAGEAVILTDQEDAVVQYTALIDDPDLYSADFKRAFALLLASEVAMKLVPKEELAKTKIDIKCLRLYEQAIGAAMVNAAREEIAEKDDDSSLLRARG